MTPLGRGGSHLTFTEHTVTKCVKDVWEPAYMRRFPEVFVPVTGMVHLSFTMPRLVEPDLEDLPQLLLEGGKLLEHLWATEAPAPPIDWKGLLLLHLTKVVKDHDLDVEESNLRTLLDLLPQHARWVCIHGDPTFANLLEDPKVGPRWIDPLHRNYIPGDPHVDLGKLFQSCAGYERILLGESNPTPDFTLMQRLAERRHLNSGLGMVWCVIHFIRLIPYQREGDRPALVRLFEDLLEVVP